MSHNQQEKDVSFSGQTYRIRKFTPEIACFWAMRFFGNAITGVLGQGKFSMAMVGKLIGEFVAMQRNDHALFQRDCLSSVYVVTPQTVHPLVNSEGFLTVPDIPSPVVFALTVASFEFSMRDFFDPSLLAALAGAIPGLSSMFEKTGSETSSSSQSD